MEAADEVAKLPDVWAGKHVEHWRRANDGEDTPLEQQFGQKLKGKVVERHESLHVGFAQQAKRQRDLAARAIAGVQRRVGD